VAALLTAVVVVCLGPGSKRLCLTATVLKALYGLLGTLLLVTAPRAQFGYLVPWLWLLMVPTEKNQGASTHDTFPRALLCLVAAWQSLQIYPVAGTQVTVATFLPVLVYSLCLHDALTAFPLTSRALRDLPPRTALLLRMLALVGVFYLFLGRWCSPLAHWRSYASYVPLDLPGAQLVRLPDYQVDTYRSLASYLRANSDVFLTYPGLNSMYFWTGKLPPASINLNGEGVLPSAREQTQILAALRQAKHPLMVVNARELRFGMGSKSFASSPLGYFVRDECREVQRVGGFRILAPTNTASQ
jgi:hypothetical protein